MRSTEMYFIRKTSWCVKVSTQVDSLPLEPLCLRMMRTLTLIPGTIRCRFGDPFKTQEFSSLLRQMYRISNGRTNHAGLRYPFFSFAQIGQDSTQFLEFTGTKILDSKLRLWYGQEAQFILSERGVQYTLELCLGDTAKQPISGFPRAFG